MGHISDVPTARRSRQHHSRCYSRPPGLRPVTDAWLAAGQETPRPSQSFRPKPGRIIGGFQGSRFAHPKDLSAGLSAVPVDDLQVPLVRPTPGLTASLTASPGDSLRLWETR